MQNSKINNSGNNSLPKEERKELDRLKRQEAFINKFISIWGSDNFDFSQVYYINQNTLVTIICKEHGPCSKTPVQFLKKHIYPCPKCLKEKQRQEAEKEFIQKCKDKFGDRFDYSKIYYDGYDSKITVTCNIHHLEYIIRADNFLKGDGGCPECLKENLSKNNSLTTEEFIEKAKAVHGDKYDYSKVNYVNYDTPVILMCPIHGEFEILPKFHLRGDGCSLCSKEKRIDSCKKPQEQFIQEVIEKHGDKFDLSQINYINNYTPVIVTCKKHNEIFSIRPFLLLESDICCPKCRSEYKTKTTEQFIQEAKAIWGDTYDYSETIYVNANTKVKIICPQHGPFYKNPGNHIHEKQGCPYCSKILINTASFITRALEIYGEDYDYSEVNVVDLYTPVKIICKEHGPFWRTPDEFLNKKFDCPICKEKRTHDKKFKSQEQFLKELYSIFGDAYDYSKVVYVDCYTPVELICKEHGPFFKDPLHLLNRQSGCPLCSISKGELTVRSSLIDLNINFKKSKTFENCRYIRPLPFDFYLPDYNCCIEYQGEQHYRPSTFGQFSLEEAEQNFKEQQIRDQIKKDFCKESKISLIEIKYNLPLVQIEENLKEILEKGNLIKCPSSILLENKNIINKPY